jgi:RimJ/RimL family protein N-acetyltransferase
VSELLSALHFPIPIDGAIIRAFEPGDFEQFCAYWCLPEVARYVPWPPDDRERAAVALARRITSRTLERHGDRLMLAVVVEDARGTTVVGEVMLAWEDGDDLQGEVGYALHPAYQGRGLARAATAAMLRLGFEQIGLHRMFGRIDPRNGRSAALLVALGMRQEGHLREVEFAKDEWCDQVIYAIREDEWRAQSTAGS